MSKRIRKIELIFENCEIIRLKPNMFKYLFLKGISTDKRINCFQYKNGETQDCKQCKYFHIEINEEGKKVESNLSKKPLNERIVSKDIVGISLYYINNEEETIYVPWNEDDEYTNKYQENRFGSDGKIEIIIGEV